MMNQKDKLKSHGVSEKTLTELQKNFNSEFTSVFTDNDITLTEYEIAEARQIFYQVVLEIATHTESEQTVNEYIETLNDEFGQQAGRNNIFFISGRIAAETENETLAQKCRQLYGNIKKQEMTD